MNPSPDAHNPFVGLRPFEAADSLYFFGRDAQVRELLERLDRTHFLAVLGSSGCGKSSLVKAGLLPHLQGGFLVEDRAVWRIAEMRPGDAPLPRLAQAVLRAAAVEPDAAATEALLEAMCSQGLEAILDTLRPALERERANSFLLVDQFEELFRHSREEGEPRLTDAARDFVSLMLQLAEQRDLPVYVALTMRSDFLGDCALFAGLPDAMNCSQYLVPRLGRVQRREAITGPVRLAGQSVSPRLVDRLLNEPLDTHDDLPIIQHVLLRTWNKWHEAGGAGAIDETHYLSAGTVTSALEAHAEEALIGMSPRELKLAEHLFQALTETDAANRRVRRPRHLAQLTAIAESHATEVGLIVDRFRTAGRSFLYVSSDLDPVVDISHESLIRQWPRLRGWVDEEAAAVIDGRRLQDRALRYRAKTGALLHKGDLAAALQWWQQHAARTAWASSRRIDLGSIKSYVRKSTQEERIAREQADAQKRRDQARDRQLEAQRAKALAEKRVATRFRIIASVALAMALAALAFGTWAMYARHKAQQARDEEQAARRLAERAAGQAVTNLQQAWVKQQELEALLAQRDARQAEYDNLRANLVNLKQDNEQLNQRLEQQEASLLALKEDSEVDAKIAARIEVLHRDILNARKGLADQRSTLSTSLNSVDRLDGENMQRVSILLSVQGRVTIERPNTAVKQPATPGDRLPLGTRIETGPGSRATVSFGGGAFELLESTVAIVTEKVLEAPKGTVRMLLDASVESLRLQTEQVNAAIKG